MFSKVELVLDRQRLVQTLPGYIGGMSLTTSLLKHPRAWNSTRVIIVSKSTLQEMKYARKKQRWTQYSIVND